MAEIGPGGDSADGDRRTLSFDDDDAFGKDDPEDASDDKADAAATA